MKAEDIFLAALEMKTPAERVAYLDGACGNDVDLRAQVDALIAAHDQAGSFLEQPLFDAQPTISQPTIDQPPLGKLGTQIGPYKLLQQIGEGGFGVVYMAEQTEPVERRVALKIIKPGMDTQQVIARFEAEEQALAMMDHPNIAKVFEVGTTESGRPYFAMELVRGIPITQYCDAHHLTPRERLELFVPVCHAIQHAHQKGIIHRDIKPTNVLVAEYDDRPVPKIIDFGVAKAIQQRLTERTMFTQFGQVVGTIDYMSPEQAKLNELDIDTRSDIYSLGVLLYELLTGDTPFDRQRLRSAAFDELLRIIREEEPPRPSIRLSSSHSLPAIAANRQTEPRKLSTLVRGELDWIVMKALEKDRTRRYETTNGFADDIQRYLNDEPVVACPPSAAYRFRKFARRNKFSLALAATIVVALASLAIIASLTAGRFRELANRNAALASNLQDALGAAEKNLERAQTQEREAQGNLALARQQERQAQENLQLANAEQQRAEGNLDLALKALDAVYLDAIGTEKLLGDPLSRSQVGGGNPARAPLTELEKELLRRGLKFYDQFAQQNVSTPRAAVQTAQAYHRVGWIQAGLGDDTSAGAAFREAVARFEELARKEPNQVEYHQRLAESYEGLAQTNSDWSQARPQLERALSCYTTAIALSPEASGLYCARAGVLMHLGNHAEQDDDVAKAADLAPKDVNLQYNAADIITWRNRERARPYAERALALDPNSALAHLAMARSLPSNAPEHLTHLSRAIEIDPKCGRAYHFRGMYFLDNGESEKALADADRALEANPDDILSLIGMAQVLISLGRYDEAEQHLLRALSENQHFAGTLKVLGELRLAQGRYQEAANLCTQAIVRGNESHAYKRRAVAHAKLGQYAAALEDLRTSLNLDPGDLSALNWLGSDIATAPEDFRQGLLALAEDAIKRSPNPADFVVANQRGMLYYRLGRLDEALADFSRHLELQPDNPGAWENWASIHEQRGDFQLIVDAVAKAVAVKSDAVAPLPVRARALVRLGRPAEAIEDYTRLIERLPEQTSYRLERGRLYQKLGKSTEADADFEAYLAPCLKAVTEQPQNWTAWNQRGIAYTHLRRYEEAIADFGKAIELSSGHVAPLQNRAASLLEIRRWSAGAEDLAKLAAGQTSIPWWRLHYELALTRLAAGDDEAYRAACQRMIQALRETGDPQEAQFIAWTCALAAGALDDYEPAIAFARRAADSDPKSTQFLTTLGAILYRAGRTQEAITHLTESDGQMAEPNEKSNVSPAYAWYFLAMAHHQAGHPDESRSYLEKANASTTRTLDDPIDPLPWNRKLTLELLRHEAEKLLGDASDGHGVPDSEAVPEGESPKPSPTESPKDAAEGEGQ